MNTIASKPASLVTGHFDHVTDGKASGWAYAPQSPDSRRTIEILANGILVARGTADLPRADLARAGIGDGGHHFSLRLSYELHDGNEHALVARDADTGVILAGGPHPFQTAPRQFDLDLMPRAHALKQLSHELADPSRAPLRSRANRLIQAFEYTSLLQETGDLATARGAYQMLGQHLDKSALVFCKLGEVNLLMADEQEALNAFDAAIDADAGLVWAHVGRGQALTKLHRPFDAEVSWRQATELQPDFPGLRSRLDEIESRGLEGRVDAMTRQGLQTEAQNMLTLRLIENAEDTQAHTLLGRLLTSYAPPADLPGMQTLTAHDEALNVLEHLLLTADSRRHAA